MGIILAVYTNEAFKEYVMPAINNADHSIMLNKDVFHLQKDIALEFEVINDIWKLKTSKNYRIYLDGAELQDTIVLASSQILRVLTADKKQIILMARVVKETFSAYEKYSINRLRKITIGMGAGNHICYDYQRLISSEHAEIVRQGNGYVISNKGQNGLYVNSKFVTGTETLRFGDFINIYGLHMVYLGEVLAIDINGADVVINDRFLTPYTMEIDEEDDESLEAEALPAIKTLIHRSPRIISKIETDPVEIEEPPKEEKSEKKPVLMTIGPSFTMAIPMMMGSVMMIAASRMSGGTSSIFMYSGLVMALSSALVGVIWGSVNMRYERKREAEKEALRYDAYGKYLLSKTDEIRTKYASNQNALLSMYPDAATCVEFKEDTPMLWGRNATHEDFLSYRLGLGDVDFQVPIQIPKKKFTLTRDELAEKPAFIVENYKTLTKVPILVDLLSHKLVGIVGGDEKKGAIPIARLLAAQIAACNCYTDVKMIFIYNEENSEDAGQWDFAKWFPHVWSLDKKTRYIAANKMEAGEVFYDLAKVFRQRLENAEDKSEGGDKGGIVKPYFIMFLSDPSLIEDEMISRFVFDSNEALGLTTVMLSSASELLPNSCEYIIENDKYFQGAYNVSAQKEDRTEVAFDNVSKEKLEAFARYMSNMEVQEMEVGGEIPSAITFFDMYGISRPSDLKAEERWLKNRNYDNIRGLIGQKAGGAPCYMDVHEKYHGPHGLVAGTTGSGKSETLQTYMLSLAINYSPDDIGFFVIDYKGGGMANLFDGLPHMIGQISNLSGNQVYRAMVSIKSENRRRQRIFTENGVNNINNYTKLYKNGEAEIPIPHLFIVIDEFAELKREEPEFMKELISVAQVGRSLGVHLILATQKPSGTVDDNIWSNSKFRLCLRVQDRMDSMDMLHKPDAAYITQAGRCYLQVGNDEVYELFQSGWSGAPYDEATAGQKTIIARLITNNGKVESSGGFLRKSQEASESGKKRETTQLDAVKEYLNLTAKRNGYQEIHQLWMPVLPDHIYLEQFGEVAQITGAEEQLWETPTGPWGLDLEIGMVDDPRNQAQVPLVLDFANGGHHGIIGSVVSGKSTMMQTILYGLTRKYSPEYLNIYGLDFSSKMMSAFENMPHCGGIMYENDLEKISKFFNMIGRILDDRKKAFRGGNYSQYVRVHGMEYPAIVIAIDNFSAFKEKTKDAYENQIIQLSKEGVGHGIFLLLSGGGFGLNEIPGRIAENLKTILCLEMADRFAYADVLHTLQIEVLPESGIKGRGLALYDSRILEYQTALALEAEDDYQRINRISDQADIMSRQWTGKRAQEIPEIPEKPTWSIFESNETVQAKAAVDSLLPVAYDASNAEIYSLDLAKLYCYLITGIVKTGKKNYMKVMIESARLKQSHIAIVDGNADMNAYSVMEGVHYLTNEEEVFRYLIDTFKPEFLRRNAMKRELLAQGGDEEELYDLTRKEQPMFIFIADMNWFVKMLYAADPAKNMAGFFEAVIQKGRYHNIYFVSALNLEDKAMVSAYQFYMNFVSYRNGIHFGGNVAQNTIFTFDYVPFAQQVKKEKPGIGNIPEVDGEVSVEKIVVPLVQKRKK